MIERTKIVIRSKGKVRSADPCFGAQTIQLSETETMRDNVMQAWGERFNFTVHDETFVQDIIIQWRMSHVKQR